LIKLPFKGINNAIGGGLRRGYTSILSGPPGNAKSFFAINTMIHAIENGVSACYLPFEYSAAEHMLRVMAVRIGSWNMISTTPDKAQERYDAFMKNADMIAEYHKYEKHVCENPFSATVNEDTNEIQINSVNFSDVLEIVKYLGQRHKLVIIDPITAIMPNPILKAGITEQQTEFIRSVNALATKFDFHPMLVGHTGRRAKHNGKPTAITMDDMSGAIAFQRFAQYVFLLDYHEQKVSAPISAINKGDIEHTRTLIIDKTSFGSGNKAKIAMDFKHGMGPQMEDLGWI
jgi:predicted ATP-dependent serine protease